MNILPESYYTITYKDYDDNGNDYATQDDTTSLAVTAGTAIQGNGDGFTPIQAQGFALFGAGTIEITKADGTTPATDGSTRVYVQSLSTTTIGGGSGQTVQIYNVNTNVTIANTTAFKVVYPSLTNSQIDKRIYTVKYKFPANNTDDNVIVWNAKSTTDAFAEDNKISGYNVEGLTTVNRFENTKNVKIYGKPSTSQFTFKNHTTSTASTSGSSTTLTLTAANNDIKTGMVITGTGVSGTVTVSNVSGTTVTMSTAQTISSTTITFTEYWTGSAWSSSATTLTVDAQGVYTVPLAFYETTVSKKYYITIAAVAPTSLLSPLSGNVYDNSTPGTVQNPFYINQYADTTLTLTAAGTGVTVTSSNVTSTYTALGFPVETSSFFKVPLTITGTASSNITANRDPELEDFTNYNSNDMDWDYEFTSTTIDNSGGTKTISIVGDVFIDKYGSASTTSSLQLDNFLSLASGGGGGGQIMWEPSATGSGGFINIAKGTYDDGTYDRTNSKLVDVGVADNTSVSGNGTIYGNFYGNSVNQITLSITPGPGNTDSGTACVDGLSVTKGSLTGSGASQELTYTWAGAFDEVVTASSNAKFNVQVELDMEP